LADLDRLWNSPLADLAISSSEIHVWIASMNQPAACVRRLAQTLSADEQLRAKNFHFEQDQLNFIIGRGLLRMILGRYLGIEPSRLCFRYGSCGKPSLAPKGFQNPSALVPRFSLAHSHDLALYTVTRDQEIGVDLEYVSWIAEADQIAEKFFSARERAVFHTLPASQKQEAFFNCWTRKEAYLKASGCGLDWPLDKVEVSLVPGEPARLLSVAGDIREAFRWFVQALTPAPGYVAALAVRGHGWQLKHWDFNTEFQCGLERRKVCPKRF
jgi:4'-phosphopantetheinyl transferase